MKNSKILVLVILVLVIIATLSISIYLLVKKFNSLACNSESYTGLRYKKNMKVIIFIMSGNNLSEYEEFEKKIWKSYMNTYDHIFDCKIIYSGKEEKLSKNEWILSSPMDKFYGCNVRIFKALQKVKNQYDFYMIAPLSLFVQFENFIKYLTPLLNYNKPLYNGYFVGRGGFPVTKWATYPILNNQSVNILLKEGMKKKYHNYANDVWISYVLQSNGVSPVENNMAAETYPCLRPDDFIPAKKIRDVYHKYALIRFKSPRYGGQNDVEEKKTRLYLLDKVYNKKLIT